MTIPLLGPVSLASIRTEFSAPAGTPLHDFVRGGSYVPNQSPNFSVPTSPPISIDDLRGAAGSGGYTPMSAFMADVDGSGSGSGTKTVGTAHVSVFDGTPPYSYAWSITSGSNFVLSPSGDDCGITQTNSSPGNYTETLTCTITDSEGKGGNQIQEQCTVTFERTAAYVPMTVTVTPTSLSGSSVHVDQFFPHVGTLSVSVQNGDGPYSYQWTETGDMILLGTTTGTSVDVYAPSAVGSYAGTITCTVTDTTTATADDSSSASWTVNAAYTPMNGSMSDVSGSTTFGVANDLVGTAHASVTGGNAGKTYTFSKVSGDTSHFTITPSGDDCTITVTRFEPTGQFSMTLKCHVDDGTDTLDLFCTVTDHRT